MFTSYGCNNMLSTTHYQVTFQAKPPSRRNEQKQNAPPSLVCAPGADNISRLCYATLATLSRKAAEKASCRQAVQLSPSQVEKPFCSSTGLVGMFFL